MRIIEIVNNNLTFRIEVRGSHHGQSDRTLIAYRDGQEVGYIEYSDYEEKPHVQMISVPDEYRRQGIGTAMVQRLQAEYPNTEINMGTLTAMGAKLIGSMPHTVHPNKEYERLKKRLSKLQAQEQQFQKLADAFQANPTEEGRQAFIAIADQWNDLNDKIGSIEDRLVFMQQATRTFDKS